MEAGPEQFYVFGILETAMVFFVWGNWRYDLVAVLALLACVYIGVVPVENAFHGFGHPAVITVAAVLIISRGLQASGVVDALVRLLAMTRRTLRGQIFAGCAVGAALSAFMNNVGALALMLPVVLRNAHRAKRPPSQVLMPLSFATLLGGLVTMIGTPPNIVIATYRQSVTGAPFAMFDFAHSAQTPPGGPQRGPLSIRNLCNRSRSARRLTIGGQAGANPGKPVRERNQHHVDHSPAPEDHGSTRPRAPA
jgi:hypothetical protein